ncbi:MAG: HXXEE domain-containing protein [Micrococcales bacterium]|nr:HXXEE domain-containing protein [Micrococcales bacterium]MCL2667065.1 HXXEE domain-containing protein [Micrococcales bacterium]
MDDVQKAAAGLFAAWCVNDLEEWFTLSSTSRLAVDRIPGWVPIPDELRRRGLSDAHGRLAIALVGVAFAAASTAGVVTRGRSPLFRGALLGFGLHGYGHLASSVATRGYTSGAVTAATTVIPYWHWARKVLATHDLCDHDRSALTSALALLPLVPAAHLAAYAILRDRSLGPEE